MPVKFPCSVCGKPCKSNQKCIACDICNSWLHFRCIDMCISTFEKLASSLEPYYCQGCLQQHLPFSYILNTDSDLFNLENANESQASIPPCLINDAMTENDVNDTISCQYYNSGHFIEYTKQLTTKDLFMVHCNVRSLNKNLCYLQQYLSELYYKPDIIAISETRINSTNSHLHDHQMHGYSFFHCDSTTKAGGVGAYIKNTIDAKHIQELSKSFDGCESLWIEVGLNKENIIVGVVYRHPHNNMNVF